MQFILSGSKILNISNVVESGPDLAMWGPRARSDEGAPKGQNKMRYLR